MTESPSTKWPTFRSDEIVCSTISVVFLEIKVNYVSLFLTMRPNQFFCTTNFVKYRDINQPEASLKVKDFTMIMRMRQRKKDIYMNCHKQKWYIKSVTIWLTSGIANMSMESREETNSAANLQSEKLTVMQLCDWNKTNSAELCNGNKTNSAELSIGKKN